MKKFLLITPILMVLTACQSAPKMNTQLNADFQRITQGKAANELADLLYAQATVRYHNQFSDTCTQMQIGKSDHQVIFDSLLFDAQCGNQIRSSTQAQIDAHLQSIKQFRINEIQKTPTALALIKGGVIQVYRYYLMPERKLIGEFQISSDDVKSSH